MVVNSVCSLFLQAACESFDVRGKNHIEIPKRYSSNVNWEPQHYRLVQDSQPWDLSKGNLPVCHLFHTPQEQACLRFLPRIGILSPPCMVSDTTRGALGIESMAQAPNYLSCCIQEPVGRSVSREHTHTNTHTNTSYL